MKLPKFFETLEGQISAILIIIVIVLFGYYFYATGGKGTAPVTIEINATDHVKGNLTSQITLVEFGDFQCPSCGGWEPTVEKVIKDNEKDIKFVFKNFPLTQMHMNALLAAKSAESAGVQGKYWEMHDMIYAGQKEWSESPLAKDLFISYAQKLGLDIEKFKSDLNNKSIEDNILAEYTEGTKLGVQGTPTFFLNGKKLEGMQSFNDLEKLVKEEIEKQKTSN